MGLGAACPARPRAGRGWSRRAAPAISPVVGALPRASAQGSLGLFETSGIESQQPAALPQNHSLVVALPARLGRRCASALASRASAPDPRGQALPQAGSAFAADAELRWPSRASDPSLEGEADPPRPSPARASAQPQPSSAVSLAMPAKAFSVGRSTNTAQPVRRPRRGRYVEHGDCRHTTARAPGSVVAGLLAPGDGLERCDEEPDPGSPASRARCPERMRARRGVVTDIDERMTRCRCSS